MQIYLDNIVFTIQTAGGVSMYWYELLKGLCNSDLPLNFLNADPHSDNLFEQQLDYSPYPCIRESWIPSKYLRYLPLRYTLPSSAVFHGGYLRVSPQKDIVNILTLHDFAHERRMATRFPRGLANIRQKAYGIRHADGIICISESTRKELLYFYPKTDPEKVRVIHHGIADCFYPLNKQQPPDFALPPSPYILYIGVRGHYKNFDQAVATLQLLPAQYQLVIAGGEPWQSKDREVLEQAIPGRYHILRDVSSSALNILYNYAWCLLYPSSYEGFGFPPGEAMKAGCPVVATYTTSIPEVTGTAGLLVNNPSPAAFAEKIQLLEDQHFRDTIIQAGYTRSQFFTWDKSIQETIAFYKHCWNTKFSL
ncbi:MAG: glycosyl transferase group 1 [Bacteroidetes bacterium]|nr:glycosyl transferase group 1 [Bacteroidota bacterium]